MCALCDLLLLSPSAQPSSPMISLTTVAGLTVLTQSRFSNRLKISLQCLGYNPRMYSVHSFRRGSASWAFEAGLPGEIIQSLGDWRSDAYKYKDRYDGVRGGGTSCLSGYNTS